MRSHPFSPTSVLAKQKGRDEESEQEGRKLRTCPLLCSGHTSCSLRKCDMNPTRYTQPQSPWCQRTRQMNNMHPAAKMLRSFTSQMLPVLCGDKQDKKLRASPRATGLQRVTSPPDESLAISSRHALPSTVRTQIEAVRFAATLALLIPFAALAAAPAKPFERFDGCLVEPDEWTDGDSFASACRTAGLKLSDSTTWTQPNRVHAGNAATNRPRLSASRTSSQSSSDNIVYGYDLGISSRWETKEVNFTPQEWAQRMPG